MKPKVKQLLKYITGFKALWFNKLAKTTTSGKLNCIDLSPSNQKQKSYIISFAGDTSLGDYHLNKPRYRNHYERLKDNPFSFFEGVKPLVDRSDFFVLNYASVLADNPPESSGSKKIPDWNNSTRTTDVFKKLGVNAVNLANNYTMSYGPEVMLETKKLFEQAGISCFGAGKGVEDSSRPIKLKLKGETSSKTVYIFTGMYASKRYREKHNIFANKYGPGIKHLSLTRLKRNIVYIREMEPDALIIIFPRWQGLKYRPVTAKIKDICSDLVAAGADYIFGHGTHMYEGDKKVSDGAIVYSLGNFVFNQPGQYSKYDALPYSVILQLKLEEDRDGWRARYKMYPILSDNKISEFRPKLIETSEANKFYKFVNENLQDGYEVVAKSDADGFYYIINRMIKNNNSAGNDLQIATRRVANKSKSMKNIYRGNYHSNADLFVKELIALGYEVKLVRRFVIAHVENKRLLFFVSDTSSTSLLGAMIINNKAIARGFLKESGVSIAKGSAFSKKQKEQAKHFALNLPTTVIKPADCNRGAGVTVDITSKTDFEKAWYSAVKASKSGEILVEEQFKGGIEARYLVVGGKCIAITEKVPPYVTGNGFDTVANLLKKKNDERAKNPHLRSRLIKLDEHRLSVLKRQGYNLSSIPRKGDVVIIDLKVGFPIGSDSFDITDEVHPLFKQIAEKAASAVPGLDVVGIDLLAYDHTQAPGQNDYIVIEVNNRPGLGSHLYPVYGKPRNVIKEIVDYTLKTMKNRC